MSAEQSLISKQGNRQKTSGESSSTFLTNSIPGIRHKELQYPLDKYLPRTLKREETFIKSREIPLRKDVSLFRKIESLLKESQCIREPVPNNPPLPTEVSLNPSNESSISTEDLVAAEFYKATYGTPKKTECPHKPSVPSQLHHKGAGDWVDTAKAHKWEPGAGARIANSECREGASALPISWDCHHRVSVLPQKTIQTEPCLRPSSLQTVKSFDGPNFDHDESKDEEKIGVPVKENPVTKCKMSFSGSCSSAPSVSLPREKSPLKKVTVHNAGINTDRMNTHVFNIKHPEPDVADDFANQSRIKSFVVQELPKVNIRARLVKQRCGIVSINPVLAQTDVQNTAVVEVSHFNRESAHLGAGDGFAITGSPKRALLPGIETIPIVSNRLNQHSKCDESEKMPQEFTNWGSEWRQEAVIPKYSSDKVGTSSSQQSVMTMKSKIFDTVSHIKEHISQNFNARFAPIQRSLTEMVASLNEFCDIGLHDFRLLQGVSASSKIDPLTLQDRVERMDEILNEELKKWGQRDTTHYNLLRKSIDELTREIKTVVESFTQQKILKEKTPTFLEGSITSIPPGLKTIHENVKTSCFPEALRLNKLFTMQTLLKQTLPTIPVGVSPNLPSDVEKINKKNNYFPASNAKFDETFTIDLSPPEVDVHLNNDGSNNHEASIMAVQAEHKKDETPVEYEDDFDPEEAELQSENNSNQRTSESHSNNTEDTDENLLVLRTSGSANGEESTDLPMRQVVREEPPLSIASTLNASQANVKAKSFINSHKASKSSMVQADLPVQALKTVATHVGEEASKLSFDKYGEPTVRLTNRNTNQVFELRLPEQLENLNSTITYNSVGCNDEIKLSFGCSGVRGKVEPTRPENMPPASSDSGTSSKVSQEPTNGKPSGVGFNDHIDVRTCAALQIPDVSHERVVTVGTATAPEPIPRITVQNQATQFPSVEINTGEIISARILTLFESKMNEMVENSRLQLIDQRKRENVIVQVPLEKEKCSKEQQTVMSPKLPSLQPISQALSSSDADINTPENEVVTTPNFDDYDSHSKHLEKPSDHLVFRESERDVGILQINSSVPVLMESSLSSVVVPSSISEFPVDGGSTSSSELAFPLDRISEIGSFRGENIQRLLPAPVFEQYEDTGERDDMDREIVNQKDYLDSISSHLHPNPGNLAVFHLQGPLDGGVEEAADNPVTTAAGSFEVGNHSGVVYEIQPYDSDMMSEGEVGYIYTSHSYSSGEIVERQKLGRERVKLPSGCQSKGDILAQSTNSNQLTTPSGDHVNTGDNESCAGDTSAPNETTSSETTTSETDEN